MPDIQSDSKFVTEPLIITSCMVLFKTSAISEMIEVY